MIRSMPSGNMLAMPWGEMQLALKGMLVSQPEEAEGWRREGNLSGKTERSRCAVAACASGLMSAQA